MLLGSMLISAKPLCQQMNKSTMNLYGIDWTHLSFQQQVKRFQWAWIEKPLFRQLLNIIFVIMQNIKTVYCLLKFVTETI